MNKVQKYKELKQIISEKRKELKIRIERLHYNIFAGVSENSINTEKDEIPKLESQIDSLEYIYISTWTIYNKMNKEEFIIDEKIYENHEGLKIKIVISNLGRRYKKRGEHLYLMLEKKELKLEDKLTAMVRI